MNCKFFHVFFLIALVGSIQSKAQGIDSSAIKIVQGNLDIIVNFLRNPSSDPSLRRAKAISFLTKLTGIPSQSDGSYAGQLDPTKIDRDLWQTWLSYNKTNISWNFQTNSIVLKKSVLVPKE